MAFLDKLFGKKTADATQSQTAAVRLLHREFHEIRSRHLTPASLVQTLRSADHGDLLAQADLFTEMEVFDAHIFAEMQKRKLAVSQLELALKPARDAGAREKKDVANLELRLRDRLKLETLVFDMADAIGRGFQCHEIEWVNTNGFWLPLKLHQRPQRWFTVDQDTRLSIRLRSPSAMDGMELQQYGWLVHQHSSSSGYPATQGLYRSLLVPYLYKNYSTRDFAEFLEIYGLPIRVGKYQPGAGDDEKKALMQAVVGIGHNAGGIIPAHMELELLQATGGGGPAPFMSMVDWAERSVSKAILGGTLTSQADGKTSTNALGTVHDDARLRIRDHDAQQIAETLTEQLLGAIIAINGLNLRARWVFDTQEPEDLALYADALPKLVAAGAQIPARYVHDKLKIPLPEGDEPVLAVAQTAPKKPDNPAKTGLNADFVTLAGVKPVFTPEQQVIEALGDQLLDHLPSPIASELIASAIRAATSPEDLEARLAAVLQGADLTEFSRTLEKALFAADVLGYAHAD